MEINEFVVKSGKCELYSGFNWECRVEIEVGFVTGMNHGSIGECNWNARCRCLFVRDWG